MGGDERKTHGHALDHAGRLDQLASAGHDLVPQGRDAPAHRPEKLRWADTDGIGVYSSGPVLQASAITMRAKVRAGHVRLTFG